MNCKHEIWEKEIACADGMCPICQQAEIKRLREQCAGLARSAMNNGQDLLLKEAEIERLRAEIELVSK